jgi:hypothetical protein
VDAIFSQLLPAAVTGLCVGLILWGGIRTELRWLRRDVDLAHERINDLEDAPARVVERRTRRIPSRTRGSGARRR